MSVVLAAEAIELQAYAMLASGGKLRTSTAHSPTHRHLDRVINNIGRPVFLLFAGSLTTLRKVMVMMRRTCPLTIDTSMKVLMASPREARSLSVLLKQLWKVLAFAF